MEQIPDDSIIRSAERTGYPPWELPGDFGEDEEEESECK